MKKRFMMFTLLAAAFSGVAHADDAAIRQSLAKLGVQSTEIQPSPVAGMKTVLTTAAYCTSLMTANILFKGRCMT